MASPTRKLLFSTAGWLLLWAACTACVLSWLGRPFREDFFVDEIYWLGSSYYCHLAWEARDTSSPDWQLLPARENPPVTKYLIGLTLAATGQQVRSLNLLGCFYLVFEGRPKAWGGPEDRAKRQAVVDRMDPVLRDQIRAIQKLSLTPELIRPIRLLMLGCAAATSLVVFLWGRRFLPAGLALVASQALLIHPVVREAYNHAMADAPAMFLSTAAAFLIFRWARGARDGGGSIRRGAGRAVVAGLVLALACGAKMNALLPGLAGVILGCWLAADAFREPGRPRLRRILTEGALLAGSALALFFALNPALWPAPVDGLVATYAEQARDVQIQADDYGIGLENIGARLRSAADLATFGLPLLAILSLGAGMVLRARRRDFGEVALWWVVAVAFLVLWMPLPRERYVVPLAVPGVLLAAGLMALIWEQARARFRSAPAVSR